MLTLMTFLLTIILLSRITEETLKIPSTLSLILYSFLLSYFFPSLLTLTDKKFDDILYLMLPIILLPDILSISINELKRHTKEIFYLAFVAVIFSIGLALVTTPYILSNYQWEVGSLIALFSMLMATDAISVASIMSKFELPKRLKIYAESESLFNDVTALIIFYFVALPLISGESVTFVSLNIILFKVLFLSIAIGVVVATFGYLATKILKNRLDQFIILYLIVIVSFLVAEHIEVAGILSIVASVLTFKIFVINNLKRQGNPHKKSQKELSPFEYIKSISSLTQKEFSHYKHEAILIAVFANGVVFVIISNIVNIESLQKYTFEILSIFALTTFIRFLSVGAMVKRLKLPNRWIVTLTFAGSKGALAIIMSHSLPESFPYRDMFIAIVVGVVLLSTFVYTIILMIYIYLNQKDFKQDIITYDKESENKSAFDKLEETL